MTDNEIIKALEHCSQHKCDCECPKYYDTTDVDICRTRLIRSSLDLINRLQADKEALIAGQETLQKALAEKNAEVERLQSYKILYEDLKAENLETINCIKSAKAEATKELADKIESRLANNTDISNEQYQSIIWDISEACKEVVGDTE